MAGCKLGIFLLMLAIVKAQYPPMDAYVEGLLDFYVPRSSTNNTQCRMHCEMFVAQVLRGESGAPWARQMLDSSAHAPSVGLLQGSVHELGHFDLCLTVDMHDLTTFDPKYFLVDVRMNLSEQSVLSPLVRDQRLRLGFCAPSSCSDADVAHQVQASLAAMLGASGTASALVRLGNSRSLEDQRDRMDVGDIAAVTLVALLLALVVIASVLDFKQRTRNHGHLTTSKCHRALLAFSAYTNGKALVRLARPRGAISCVDGVRWLSISWVMLGHRYSKEINSPRINHDNINGMSAYWGSMVVLNFYLAVDSFFLLSGLLLAYVFLKNVEAAGKFHVLKFYLYRYIRLTPPLALVVLLYARVLAHTGSGPLWYEEVGTKETNCKARWWTNLLYVNNYVRPRPQDVCVPQTWYLAVDMQFFLLSPVLLYPLWRRPRLGFALCGVVAVLGSLTPFLITYINQFPWTSMWNTPSAAQTRFYVSMYCVMWTRSQPYVVGILLGTILFRLRGKRLSIKPVFVFLGWTLASGVALSVLFVLALPYHADYEYHAIEAASYSGLHHLGWALALAWTIFACEQGYGGPIDWFLSWSYWQPLARLSYCVYLTHMMMLYAEVGMARTSENFSHYSVAHKFPGDVVFALTAAAAISLTSEMPVLTLEKLFINKGYMRNKGEVEKPLRPVATIR